MDPVAREQMQQFVDDIAAKKATLHLRPRNDFSTFRASLRRGDPALGVGVDPQLRYPLWMAYERSSQAVRSLEAAP